MSANAGFPLVLVNPQPQGNVPIQAMDQFGISAFAAAHDQFYQQTKAGNMFQITTSSAIPITSTTAPTLVLWNPANSKYNAVLVRYIAGLSGTPDVATDILLMAATQAGSNIATAAAFTAFTAVTPTNGLIGGGNVSHMLVGTSVTATAAFFSTYMSLGISEDATTAATTSAPWWVADIWFRGSVIVPPGVAIFDAGTAATSATHRRSLFWYEMPV